MRIYQEREEGHDQKLAARRKKPGTRKLKIYSKYRDGIYTDPTIVPEIRLCGHWLADVGFLQGRTVTIEVSKEKLVIQLQPE